MRRTKPLTMFDEEVSPKQNYIITKNLFISSAIHYS